MINEILNLDPFPSEFDIQVQKNKYLNFDNSLPEYLQTKITLSKNEVIDLIRKGKSNKKTELIAILFWGVYFTVINKTSTIYSLFCYINGDNFEEDMNNKVSLILKSDSPSDLFLTFQKNKIPGLGYAYFTKLFYFYRKAHGKEPYLILDKWLCRAWCAIDGYKNNNTYVFDTYFKTNSNFHFHGELMRSNHIAYGEYIKFMKIIAEETNLGLDGLEEKLFGANIKENPINNPRKLYLEWAENNNIPKNKKENNGKSIVEVGKLNLFFLKNKKQYLALCTDTNFKNKEGYINKNGWLNVSEKLKNRLSGIKVWSNGNTNGGSKEKYKFKFASQDEAINFLKTENLQIL